MIVQIDMGFCCGGIDIDHRGKCIAAPPIMRWMIGKTYSEIERWVLRKGGKVCQAKEG